MKRRRVTGEEFVRGFLQHVLPANFHRIRYYGFLSQNSKLSLDRIRMLVWFYRGWCYMLQKRERPRPPERPPLQCSDCGGTLHLVEITDQYGRVLFRASLPDHRLPYLDSG